MLTAHQLDMTDGQYVYVVAAQVPPQNASTPWLAGDDHDDTARLAFQSVLQVRLSQYPIFSERRYMLSPVRLSAVCNVRAPYSGGSNFRQYFYGIRYLGHPLTSTENFMEIVQGEPFRRGS